MSLETWIKEFYPISAQCCNEEDALKYSLLKWEGLTEENLKKHKLSKENNKAGIFYELGQWMNIGIQDCVLCSKYYDNDCKGCPFGEKFGCLSHYDRWIKDGNALPMIRALRKLVNEKQKL